MARNRELTAAREKTIRDAGLKLETYWECEVNKMLKSDPTMRQFYDKLHSIGPIDQRDAFSGKSAATMLSQSIVDF